MENRNPPVDLAGRKKKKSSRRFGGKKSAIEIDSAIWREEIGNRNPPVYCFDDIILDFGGRYLLQASRRKEIKAFVSEAVCCSWQADAWTHTVLLITNASYELPLHILSAIEMTKRCICARAGRVSVLLHNSIIFRFLGALLQLVH
jgi:hypothetical protein